MANYKFLSDVVNHGGMVSKKYDGGPVITRGTELELDAKDPHVKWLIDGGSVELVAAEEDPNADKPWLNTLGRDAGKAISAIENSDLSEDQLNDLLTHEEENKKRVTVTKAIEDKIASLQSPDDAPPAE